MNATEWNLVFRPLRRSPGLVLSAALVMGLGLGATLILFNLTHALLWKPLPFKHSQHIAVLQHRTDAGPLETLCTGMEVRFLVMAQDIAEDTAAVLPDGDTTTLRDGEREANLRSASVSGSYFRLLGLQPIAGQFFAPEADAKPFSASVGPDGLPGVLLTETTWRTRFAADPRLPGKVVQMGIRGFYAPTRVLGIVPDRQGLPFIQGAEMLMVNPHLAPEWGTPDYDLPPRAVLLLRLKAGLTLDTATRRLNQLKQLSPEGSRWAHQQVQLSDPHQVLTPLKRESLLLLQGAASLLLVLSTVNVTALLVSRALARSHESALCGALGATPGRLFRVQAMEALILGAAGLAIGLSLDVLARPLAMAWLPGLDRLGPQAMQAGWPLVLFAIVLTTTMSLCIAILPARSAARTSLAQQMAHHSRSASGGARLGMGLLGLQVALILVLLSVTSLALRSLSKALFSDPGFRPRKVACFTLEPPASMSMDGSFKSSEPVVNALIQGLPSMEAYSWSEAGPLSPAGHANVRAASSTQAPSMLPLHLIATQWFETLGASMRQGREFTSAEVQGRAPVAILNERAATLLFPGAQALEQQLFVQPTHEGYKQGLTVRVIGIVKDLHLAGLDQAPDAAVFLPHRYYGEESRTFIVRSNSPLGALQGALQNRVRQWQPDAEVLRFQSLESLAEHSLVPRKRISLLVSAFALAGLLVASVGVYSTLTSLIAKRRREIGIRMALGAPSTQLLLGVLRQAFTALVGGTLAGGLVALGLAHLLRHALYGIGALDGLSLLFAFALLSLTIFIASLPPMLRILRMDPSEALRSE